MMSPKREGRQRLADQDQGTDHSAAHTELLAKDDAYYLLQNGRRRAVLRYLFAHGDQKRFVMRDVAEVIAAWEHDTTVKQLTSDERQRVYISLYQSHLPTLDEHDVIDYDRASSTIERRPIADALRPYLGEGLHAPQMIPAAGDEAQQTATESTDGWLSILRRSSR